MKCKDIVILCLDISLPGGTERAISNLTNLFTSDTSIKFHIISCCSSVEDTVAYPVNGIIHHLHLPGLKMKICDKLSWYFAAIPGCRKELKKIRCDDHDTILLAYGHNISIMLPFIGRGIRKYACEHINFDTIPSVSKYIMKFVYPQLSGIVVLSDIAKEKIKVLNKNIVIIPNSISFNGDATVDKTQKRIIMVGRLSAEKGYERLVEIGIFLKSNYPGWHIDVFGNGPLREKLATLYKMNGLEDIINLKGFSKHIKEEFLKSSLCILTSYTEALPMNIIEANSCGVPVLAYKCEGTEALLENGENGFIVETASEFCNVLGKLVSDEKLLSDLSVSAKEKSKNFCPDRISGLWKMLFAGMTN